MEQGGRKTEHGKLYLPCASLQMAGRGARRTENGGELRTQNVKLRTLKAKRAKS